MQANKMLSHKNLKRNTNNNLKDLRNEKCNTGYISLTLQYLKFK